MAKKITNTELFREKRNAYEEKRKATDEWFYETKSARSLLSAFVRNYVNTGNIRKSANLVDLLGCTEVKFVAYLEDKLTETGLEWADYATVWELDHTEALCEFKDLAKVIGVKATLRSAFYFENIKPLAVSSNRNHTLKGNPKKFGRPGTPIRVVGTDVCYPSLTAASTELGISVATISQAIKCNSTTQGIRFEKVAA